MKNLPRTPSPPGSCCRTIQPAVFILNPAISPPPPRQTLQILHPELPSFILPLLSSPFSSNPPGQNPNCSLHLNLPYISLHIHTFLFVNETAHSIRKGVLLLYPSQLSNTLLLYSEIFDKYLTWLKGQTWNEERAKRDFSIHTEPSYITTSSVQNVLLTTGSLDKQSQVSYPLDQVGALLRPEAAHSS